jgi:protein-S-isoprenylcysteine O-methyltransferase Ste14
MDARPEIVEGTPHRPGLRNLLWVGLFALLLFVAAGTVRWPGAWVYLALLAAESVWGLSWLERQDPGLLAERLRYPIQRGQLPADKLLMVAFVPLWFGWFVLMGLDQRFGWSNVPLPLAILGAVLLCLGMAQGGEHRPYAYVRHPMYASVLLIGVGAPLLLGSWLGLLAVPLFMLVLGVRAVMEEHMLAAELEGYADYAKRVRYRFVPRLW